ncbi:GTPase, G3E family [Marinobacter daqiaonensis]|uniref:GTPase, G3E family n=1 Tax=Marinobacter daqiaonensis TaxID=650891 RepID=A0A1I6JBB4_9GAMM|nr:GTP-binding protein [Marinobacter daqiaonensis]SFR76221.1 GTPase, G3E family [Marinobacter daqiaonensis]
MTEPANHKAIPTNLILGFLGVGKTTAILNLLRQKPAGERWAVLVNEFGEVGIDGSLLQDQGAWVREVPGGCMCCVAGLPMQIGLNQLIHRARPHRLLIEPTGLGHPSQILDTLGAEHYRDVLALGPVLTLVDPRRLEEPRVTGNVQFQDQVAAADILVANKTDLCRPDQLERFDEWSRQLTPAKTHVAHTSQGYLLPQWLDGIAGDRPVSSPHAHAHHAHREPAPEQPADIDQEPWQCLVNEGQGHVSVGWRIHRDAVFDEDRLLVFALSADVLRFKAVVRTARGWRSINLADGLVSVASVSPLSLSRLEFIFDDRPDQDQLDYELHQCEVTTEAR